MLHRTKNAILHVAATAAAIGSSLSAAAQEAAEPVVIDVEQVVVTGTRVPNRSALETAVPVDVVSSEQLSNLGVTEVNQALSVTLPSLNFPRPGLADGTDTIRPGDAARPCAGSDARAA